MKRSAVSPASVADWAGTCCRSPGAGSLFPAAVTEMKAVSVGLGVLYNPGQEACFQRFT